MNPITSALRFLRWLLASEALGSDGRQEPAAPRPRRGFPWLFEREELGRGPDPPPGEARRRPGVSIGWLFARERLGGADEADRTRRNGTEVPWNTPNISGE